MQAAETNKAVDDLTAAQQFLSLLAEGGEVTFQTFDDTDRKRPELARIFHGDLDDHAAELGRLNRAGAGVFFMVNAGDGKGRRAENVTEVRAVFADLDGAPLDPVRLCALKPHAIVESSPGRFHAYWLALDVRPEQFRPLQQGIAARFGGDVKVCDLPRVMRLPGFWHQKGKPFQTRIVELDPSLPYSASELAEEFPLPEAKPERQHQAGEVCEGNRNDFLASLAGTMRRRGMTPEAIGAALQAENLARCHPPLDPQEVAAIARSVGRYEPEPQQEAQQGSRAASFNPWAAPLDASSLVLTEPPPMRWLVDERIQLGRGILATGVGGSSKTRLLYHLGIGAVIGRLPWDWKVAATGKAVLVLTEDTAEDVHRTLHYTCKGMDLSASERDQVSRCVIPYALAGVDVRLLASVNGRDLTKTALFAALEKKILELGGVVFVGLDPALSLTAGDELDQGHQRMLGKMADDLAVRTGAAVCLVTHATKGSLAHDELGSHNSRGGGAITDAVRGEFAMRTMTTQEARKAGIEDIEERKRHVQLVATKGNHLPPAAFVPVWLKRGAYGTLSAADVVMDADHGKRPSQQDLRALAVLKDLCASHTPTLIEWRTECLDQGVIVGRTDDASKKNMQRVVNRLMTGGLIRKGFGRGIYLPATEEGTDA